MHHLDGDETQLAFAGAHAFAAGTIASSSGSPIVTPRPFNTARRERCFLVMNIGFFSTADWNAALWTTPRMNADIR